MGEILGDETSGKGARVNTRVVGVPGFCGGIWTYDTNEINIDSKDGSGAEEEVVEIQ